MSDADRRPGARRQRRARARSALPIPRALQRQPHPVRQSRARPRRQARADRPGGHAQLCRALRGSLRAGATALPSLGPEARRPHPDVPRRYAGLSGRVLRRGARRLRAAADQHADAAGPAAVLSRRFRRRGRGRRCRVLRALRCGGLQGHAAAHADRRQRRGGRSRRAERALPPTAGCRHFPAELAEADTHRNEMAFWMYSSGSTGRPKGIVHLQHDMAYSEAAFARNVLKLTPGRHLLLGAEDLLRLRLRQLHHLPVLGRRGDAAAAGPAEARGDLCGDRAATSRPSSSACRRSIRR